jgi:hypothetical protein
MAYTVNRLPNEPIIMITFIAPVDPAVDMGNSNAEVNNLAKQISGTVVTITDSRSYTPSFDHLIIALDEMRRSITSDPDFIRIIVGSDEMLGFAVKAAKQRQYGEHELPLFGKVEDALAYARSELAQRAASK